MVTFLLLLSIGNYEKILTDIEVHNFLNNEDDHNIEQDNGEMTKFKDIVDHMGPLCQLDKHYMGSKYNVQVEWIDGDNKYITLMSLPLMTLYHALSMLSRMTCYTYQDAKVSTICSRAG
jgi:hypothetical protein